ncbi:MAG: flagellar M-ring protein FliF C-terminal domain-containing protein [Pirellula sp.]|jgi:flagellar M-ring protein FliF
MNIFNKLLQDAKTLFAGMTPQARLLSVLLTGAILVSAAFLMNGESVSQAKTEYLFDGRTFNDQEIARFSVAFSNAGLKSWDTVNDRIKIPEASRAEYYKAISDANAMPDTMFGPLDAAMKSNSLLEPNKVTEAKHLTAKLKSISAALESMPGIQQAFVSYDEKREGFSSTRQKTCSIAVMPKGGIPLSLAQKRSIMNWVQKSMAGLKASDIALLDLSTSQTTMGEDDPNTLEQERFYAVKKQQEDDLRRRSLDLLKDYGDVRLDVNVELDPTLMEETSKMSFDPKPTTIQTSTSKKDEDSQKVSTQGRPGAEPNAISNRSASLTTPDQTSKSKESSENVKLVAGNTVTNTKKAGLQVKSATIAVSIPTSYYRKAFIVAQKARDPNFDETKVAPTEKDIEGLRQKVETSVKKLLGTLTQSTVPGEDNLPRVTVDEYIDFPVEEITGPSFAFLALNWLQDSWQTLMLGAIALAAIFSLKGFVAAGNKANNEDFERGFNLPIDEAADIDLTGLAGEELAIAQEANQDGEDAAANSPPRFKTTGGDIKNDLTAMVRENPDAAATLLRNWISGASA